MEGYGVYTWSDGRKYEGEYKDDKKHGFGRYTWADERRYEGWWYRGKQHGLGFYYVKGTELRAGLWEDGKRIEWFDGETAKKIEQGKVDFRAYLKNDRNPESVMSFSELCSDGKNCISYTFYKPAVFDDNLQQIKNCFGI